MMQTKRGSIHHWLDRSLGWFLLIGLGNTLLSMSLMLVLYTWLGMGYWPSSALAFVVASISSFYFNRKYSFRSQGAVFRDAVRFALVIAVCYLSAFAIAKPMVYRMVDALELPWAKAYAGQIAMVVGNGIFTVFNYIGQKTFAFSKQEK